MRRVIHRTAAGLLPQSHERGQRSLVSCGRFALIGDADVQVAQQSVTQTVNPTVYRQLLTAFPGVLDDRRAADAAHLFDYIQLAEPVQPIDGVVDAREIRFMTVHHVLHVTQPVVDQAKAKILHRRIDAATAVVAADDHVADFQYIDGKLQDRQTIKVGVDDYVGDVAMDEQVPGRKADELRRGHAAVGTANPKMARRLLPAHRLKEFRITGLDTFGPRAIVFEKLFRCAHCGKDNMTGDDLICGLRLFQDKEI